MKKLLLAPLSLVVFAAFATPAEARSYCPGSYGGECSANHRLREQQSRQLDREYGYHSDRWDHGSGYYVPNYGFDRLFYGSGGYYSTNRVKEKTARRGGVYYQDCGEEIGIVPIGTPCIHYRR